MRILSEVENKIHPITRKALNEYVKRVAEREQDNLLKIILFGSVARGEATENSDVDVLVLLKESGLQHQQEIAGITVDVQWDMNFDNRADIMSVLKSEKKFQNNSLMKNINNEGVLLYESDRR